MAEETSTGMSKTKKYWIIGGIIFLVLLVGSLLYYFKVYAPKKRISIAQSLFETYLTDQTNSLAATQLNEMDFSIAQKAGTGDSWQLIDNKTGTVVSEASIAGLTQ